MPKGEPSKQTIATEKYQRKAGYMTKGFKIKRDDAEAFEQACKRAGVSQAAQITKMMREFAEKNYRWDFMGHLDVVI